MALGAILGGIAASPFRAVGGVAKFGYRAGKAGAKGLAMTALDVTGALPLFAGAVAAGKAVGKGVQTGKDLLRPWGTEPGAVTKDSAEKAISAAATETAKLDAETKKMEAETAALTGKKATVEAQAAVEAKTSMGGVDVKILEKIYGEVVSIRGILGGKDPESEKKELKLDEQTRHKKFLAALAGLGFGGKGDKEKKSLFDLGNLKEMFMGMLPAIIAGLGLAGLVALWPQISKAFEGISDAIANINEFLDDMAAFFKPMTDWLNSVDPAKLAAAAGALRGTKTVTGRQARLNKAKMMAAADAERARIKADEKARKARLAEQKKKLKADAAKANKTEKARLAKIAADDKARLKASEDRKKFEQKKATQARIKAEKLEKARLAKETKANANKRLMRGADAESMKGLKKFNLRTGMRSAAAKIGGGFGRGFGGLPEGFKIPGAKVKAPVYDRGDPRARREGGARGTTGKAFWRMANPYAGVQGRERLGTPKGGSWLRNLTKVSQYFRGGGLEGEGQVRQGIRSQVSQYFRGGDLVDEGRLKGPTTRPGPVTAFDGERTTGGKGKVTPKVTLPKIDPIRFLLDSDPQKISKVIPKTSFVGEGGGSKNFKWNPKIAATGMYTLNGKVVSNQIVMDAIDDGTGKVKQGPALERVQHVENAAKKVISTTRVIPGAVIQDMLDKPVASRKPPVIKPLQYEMTGGPDRTKGRDAPQQGRGKKPFVNADTGKRMTSRYHFDERIGGWRDAGSKNARMGRLGDIVPENVAVDYLRKNGVEFKPEKGGFKELTTKQLNFMGEKPGVMGRIKGAARWAGSAGGLLSIVFIGWAIKNAFQQWQKDKPKGDIWPFNESSQADTDFRISMGALAAAFGVGWIAAILSGMLGTMLAAPLGPGAPIVGFFAALLGGFAAGMAADQITRWLQGEGVEKSGVEGVKEGWKKKMEEEGGLGGALFDIGGGNMLKALPGMAMEWAERTPLATEGILEQRELSKTEGLLRQADMKEMNDLTPKIEFLQKKIDNARKTNPEATPAEILKPRHLKKYKKLTARYEELRQKTASDVNLGVKSRATKQLRTDQINFGAQGNVNMQSILGGPTLGDTKLEDSSANQAMSSNLSGQGSGQGLHMQTDKGDRLGIDLTQAGANGGVDQFSTIVYNTSNTTNSDNSSATNLSETSNFIDFGTLEAQGNMRPRYA